MALHCLPGQSFPLGATVYPDGVNFCLFSKTAERVELLLFNSPNDPEPAHTVCLNPSVNKTFYYWHVFVSTIRAGQVYAYRVYGPYDPAAGHRFDGSKVLLDPYARAVAGWPIYRRDDAIKSGDNCAHALRSVVVDPSTYDWEGDRPLHIPYSVSVIYEMHVAGFTRHPNSGVAPDKRGTYAGLVEKIPYLQELGITAVELLPIQQFDEQDAPNGLTNYWGYSPMAFFAPHHNYSSRRDPMGPVDEFRDMVKALHRAGIEVILDVVFNHTAEGNESGPTFSFRGLENQAYYLLDAENLALYANFSGCGNTLKANHEIVGRMIIDALRYWVAEMHVDGFRFDLASVLSRSKTGHPMEDPPILWTIESDPILAGTKIIAEAWDAAGLYQVGTFIGDRFAEWNGPFRDDIRRFVRGDEHTVKNLSWRILGSPDIYPEPDREPNRSINFVTCHDGFTLRDLVTYNQKYNAMNGEENRDGANENFSWNCGVEGPTLDPEIEALRLHQIKNFFTILLCSQGTPMLLMGDEVMRSQNGNNNAYCQNNELSWFDWNAPLQHQGLLRFVRGLIALIQSHTLFKQERLLTVTFASRKPHLVWHGIELGKPDWNDYSHSLSFTLRYPEAHEHLHLIFNAYRESLDFELPPLNGSGRWHRLIDTALPSPKDCCSPQEAPPVPDDAYKVAAYSCVVLSAFA